MKTFLKFILCFFIISNYAFAENFYAGVGYLKSEVDTYKYPSETYTLYDDEDSGFTLFAGYNFNEYFAIEAAYNDLGDTIATIDTPLTANREVEVWTLAGVLKYEIFDNLTLLAKGGIARIDNEERLSNGNNYSEESEELYFGLGIEYSTLSGYALRVLYEEYGEDDGTTSGAALPDRVDPSAISLSIVKKF